MGIGVLTNNYRKEISPMPLFTLAQRLSPFFLSGWNMKNLSGRIDWTPIFTVLLEITKSAKALGKICSGPGNTPRVP
jgi:hypothetical protein